MKKILLALALIGILSPIANAIPINGTYELPRRPVRFELPDLSQWERETENNLRYEFRLSLERRRVLFTEWQSSFQQIYAKPIYCRYPSQSEQPMQSVPDGGTTFASLLIGLVGLGWAKKFSKNA